LVAVAAAASALADRMIAEGDSDAALRYGASEDAGFSGVVIEQGIGLNTFGLIDQNFLSRRRLGRLLVACAEEGSTYGFGLCEESGLIIAGGERSVRAIGRNGVVVAALDLPRVRLQPPAFSAAGIALSLIEPGAHFHLDTIAADAVDHSGAGLALLERAVEDLVQDYNANLAPGRAEVDSDDVRTALLEAYLRSRVSDGDWQQTTLH
jgi:cyanophycinase-like exopeptidase